MTSTGSAPAERPVHADVHGLIEEFVQRVPGIAHAVAVGSDGLLRAASAALPRDRADQLAAISAGVASLTHGAATIFEGGQVRQTMVEMTSGFLLVMAMSGGASLAVLAAHSCDIGQVGYEMTLLTERVTTALQTQPSVVPNVSPWSQQ